MLEYRVIPLPATWPGRPTPPLARQRSPFKVNWGSTMALLETEVRALDGRDVTLALAVRAEQIRRDGGVYANARIQDPAVIVGLTRGADRLAFPCDTFNWWEDNVRAIALAMQALRKVDRYNVQAGRQYQGFKQLGSGASPAPGASAVSTAAPLDEAVAVLAEWTLVTTPLTVEAARQAIRVARARTHPDRRGGDDHDFLAVQRAAETMSLFFGVAL